MSLAEDQTLYDEFDDDVREPFSAFVSDDDSYAAALALAERRGWPKGEVQRGGLAAALRQLGVVTAPETMLIDLSEAEDPAQALSGLSELAGSARVIALGTQNDVEMFRRVLEAGAADYLVKPVTTEALEAALDRALRPAGGAADGQAARRGRCIAFIGARGGVGASTLAGNTAWLIANERERRVAVVDLDLQFGSLALGFDVEPGPGLREALEDPERVDEIFLDRAAVKIGERLSVLAAEEAIDDAPRLTGSSVPQMLATLRERYDLLLLDLPRHVVGMHPDILEQLTDVVVVSDLSLAGLRDTNRLLRFLKAQGGRVQVRVVANATGKGGKGQIEPREFSRELEGELALSLTADPDATARAALAGKALAETEKRSKLLKDLRALTVELVGQPKAKRKSKGLFGIGRRAKS